MSIGAIGRAALGAIEIGRGLLEGNTTDTYDLLRSVSTADGEGGSTAAEGVVESGGCFLVAGATRPEEAAVASRVQASSPYVVRAMPYNSGVTAQDIIAIGGRRFEVLGVLRAMSLNAAITAIVEERS